MRPHGCQWWLLHDQAQGVEQVYAGLGYGGEFLLVVPERDPVAVFHAWNTYGSRSSVVIDLFLERILPGIEGGYASYSGSIDDLEPLHATQREMAAAESIPTGSTASSAVIRL